MQISKEEYEKILKEYQENQKRIFEEINKKMRANRIIENTRYNNVEMLEEYTKFGKLIDETIRTNLPNDKVICNKLYADINEKALQISFSSKQFTKIHNEILEAHGDFRIIYDEMLKQIGILKSGVSGEKKLYDRLKIIGDKIAIITNARYKLEDDFEVEHDMIIIACTGVFTVEIKNWKQDSYIDNKGIMYGPNKEKFNIVEQTMRHKHHLERILKKYTNESIPVYPIIAWVNSESSIKDDFKHIIVCNCNDIEFEILNQEKYGVCYDSEKRSKLYKILMELKLAPNVYPVQINKNELAESLSKVLAGLCIYPKMTRIEAENKTDIIDVITFLLGIWGRS